MDDRHTRIVGTGMYDAVIVGLGGMGSAALAHIARRKRRVLGLEQLTAGHELGASAGHSRIIRKAYFEDPAYVPLLLRAYELWRELEVQSGSQVLDLTGIVMVGRAGSASIAGALRSAREHGLALEELDAADVAARYRSLRLTGEEVALFERDAGMVFPELAIAAHLRVAAAGGAEMRYETHVTGIEPGRDGIAVGLSDGSTIVTERLAICAGPWLASLVPQLQLPLRVQRNVQMWFEPLTDAYARSTFPVFFVERRAEWAAPLYGFPDYGLGVKAAFHAYGDETTPATLDRTIHARDVEPVRRALDDFMPGAAGRVLGGKACMYTLTPDEHFAIDMHPHDDRIVIAGGFSGHGFKFCSVVGEIIADLLTRGETAHPIGFLRFDRLRLAVDSRISAPAHPGLSA